MTEFTVPDCLVLKFEEIEEDTRLVDTTVYVFYDQNEGHFVIRGKRRRTLKYKSKSYSFICKSMTSLAFFLQYIVCESATVNETLTNYNNLPTNSNEITFKFLDNFDKRDYEVVGFDDIKFDHEHIMQKLRMLKNIFNYY